MKTFSGYDHNKVEAKWQKIWRQKKIYSASGKKNRYYLLVELTYTSGDLHMGHWFAWCAPDAYARMKRMQGNNVLFPVGGFDAFGLPAENAAIKHGIHPREWTYNNISSMRKQFEKMGPSFDWESEVITCDPDYYRWTQWLFLQLYKKGLAYRGKVWSNWCHECKTVLANEHVENGCCWRHTSTPVEQKLVDQWLFKITDYADKLIWPKKPKVNWPQAAVEGQNNWIGRKEGITISYPVEGADEKIEVWTSRPDTNFGATFIVIAPEHSFVNKIVEGKVKTSEKVRKSIENYVNQTKNKLERERLSETREKTGVFTGLYAINQLNNRKLPIWISDFVIASFGTGAVVGVPGHDRRDFEFAQKFDIPILRVVVGRDGDKTEITRIDQIQEEEGTMVNSAFLDGLDIHTATDEIMDYIEKEGYGNRSIQYHLRDWSVSRRRYWAAPVPVIYCHNCWEKLSKSQQDKLRVGIDYTLLDSTAYIIYPVPEQNLPVKLPQKVDYTPTGKPPLATAEEWVKVDCPHCGSEAQREVETLDTYVDSSWYFFRYPNPSYNKAPFEGKVIKDWMPIKVYFGGPEHILGHTLYARFITKFLFDLGLIDFDEFALKRIHHGVILGPDGFRMSKSRGNVVNPDEQVEKFGADAVRLYINFLGPHEKGGAWKTEGIEGSHRFLMKVWRLATAHKKLIFNDSLEEQAVKRTQHTTIKKVSEDIEELHTHTAIASLMEFTNLMEDIAAKNRRPSPKKSSSGWDEALATLVKLLAPFAPHMAEELWVNVLGEKFSVHTSDWPSFDTKMAIHDRISIPVQINGKLRITLEFSVEESKQKDLVLRAAKANDKIKTWLQDKNILQEVFVPGKIVNIVTT